MRNAMLLTMLTPFVMATRECALQMMSNARFVLNELPNVQMPETFRERTRSVCNDMIGTKHDLITELFDLDELVAGEAPDEEVAERVERIVRWTVEDLVRLDGVVRELWAESDRDPKVVLGSALVSESAANVLNSFHPVQTAAEAVLRVARGTSLSRQDPGAATG